MPAARITRTTPLERARRRTNFGCRPPTIRWRGSPPTPAASPTAVEARTGWPARKRSPSSSTTSRRVGRPQAVRRSPAPIWADGSLGRLVRRRVTWVIWLPLVVAPWLGAHCLAYVLVPPGGHEHGQMHATGHGYLIYSAPILVACGITLLLTGVLLRVGEGLRDRARPHPPLRLF